MGAGGRGQEPVTGRNPPARPAPPAEQPWGRRAGRGESGCPPSCPSPRSALTPGGQAGGLGQRAQTRTFQNLMSTKTLLQPELGRGPSLGRPRRFSVGARRDLPASGSPAKLPPRLTGAPVSRDLRKAVALGGVVSGDPSLSFAPGKSRRRREAPGGRLLDSLLQR